MPRDSLASLKIQASNHARIVSEDARNRDDGLLPLFGKNVTLLRDARNGDGTVLCLLRGLSPYFRARSIARNPSDRCSPEGIRSPLIEHSERRKRQSLFLAIQHWPGGNNCMAKRKRCKGS